MLFLKSKIFKCSIQIVQCRESKYSSTENIWFILSINYPNFKCIFHLPKKKKCVFTAMAKTQKSGGIKQMTKAPVRLVRVTDCIKQVHNIEIDEAGDYKLIGHFNYILC